jgi:hypothetical protein
MKGPKIKIDILDRACVCGERDLVLRMLLLEECEQWEEWFADAEIQTRGAVESGIRRSKDWIQACRKAVKDLRNGEILNQKGVEYVTGMLHQRHAGIQTLHKERLLSSS